MQANKISTPNYEATAKDASYLGVKRTALLIGLKQGEALDALKACLDCFKDSADIVTAEVYTYYGDKPMSEKLLRAQWVSERLDGAPLKPYPATDGSGLYWQQIVPKIDHGYYAASRNYGYGAILAGTLSDIIRSAFRSISYAARAGRRRER